MVHRTLGRTGIRVSPIGFGAFKIGRNEGIKYAAGYELPSDAAVAELLAKLPELQINYIDTAPAYGTSEERLGKALSGRSNEFVISTKVGEEFDAGRSTYDFSSQTVTASIERSLKRLGREMLDIVFIHTPTDDLTLQRSTDVVNTLQRLKQSGKIRAIGLSGKTEPGFRFAFSWADVLMVEFNPLESRLGAILNEAATHQIGIVVKKGLASGKLAAAEAVPFILQRSEVGSLVIGTLNSSHLAEAAHLDG